MSVVSDGGQSVHDLSLKGPGWYRVPRLFDAVAVVQTTARRMYLRAVECSADDVGSDVDKIRLRRRLAESAGVRQANQCRDLLDRLHIM